MDKPVSVAITPETEDRYKAMYLLDESGILWGMVCDGFRESWEEIKTPYSIKIDKYKSSNG